MNPFPVLGKGFFIPLSEHQATHQAEIKPRWTKTHRQISDNSSRPKIEPFSVINIPQNNFTINTFGWKPARFNIRIKFLPVTIASYNEKRFELSKNNSLYIIVRSTIAVIEKNN